MWQNDIIFALTLETVLDRLDLQPHKNQEGIVKESVYYLVSRELSQI